MEQLVIQLKPCNIDDGVPSNMHLCPIAKAVRAKGFERIAVDHDGIYIGREGHGLRSFSIPKKAKTFIRRFDEGLPVKPISFVARRAY